jgi:hypothetical protein
MDLGQFTPYVVSVWFVQRNLIVTRKIILGSLKMKSNLVRAFVITLALAGFGATTVSAHTASKAKSSTTAKEMPTPGCVPSDPSLCGLD